MQPQQPHTEPVKLMKPGGIPYHLPPKRPLSVDGVKRRNATVAAAMPVTQKKPQPRGVIDPIIRVRHTPKQPVSQPQPPAVTTVRPPSTPMTQAVRPLRPIQAATSAPTLAMAAPQPKMTFAPQKHSKRTWRDRLSWLELPLTIIAAIIGGVLLQSLVFGEIAIGIYAVAALVFRFKSSTSFTLALLSLGTMILMLLSGRGSNSAENFATYAFLLLIIGVISLVLEQRQEAKWQRPIA